MNKQRIIELADKIEQLEHDHQGSYSNGIKGFNMSYYSDSCGSPSCIAGWIVHMYHDDPRSVLVGDPYDISRKAAELIDLDRRQADWLFEPSFMRGYYSITPAEASITLHKLAEEGKIDWSHSAAYTKEDDDVSDDNSTSE